MVEAMIEMAADAFASVDTAAEVLVFADNFADNFADVVINSGTDALSSVDNLMEIIGSVEGFPDELPTEPEPESSELLSDWVPALTLLTVWGIATHYLSKSVPEGTVPPTL